MTYRVVTHLQQEAVSVSHTCRDLQVSRSGYYAHRSAKPSATSVQERTHVKAAFAASGASYGSRRVMHALREQGLRIGRYRVRSPMRAAGLRTSWKRKFVSTTDSRHTLPVARERARPTVRNGRAQSCMGFGHHVYPHGAGLAISGGRAGPVLTQGGWLIHGAHHAGRAGHIGTDHGAATASASAGTAHAF